MTVERAGFPAQFAGLGFEGPLPVTEDTEPLGRSWLPGARRGVDLDAVGYVEEEYLLRGRAPTYGWDEQYQLAATGEASFVTRLLVRRPVDSERFSGTVQLEPHHPDDDQALTWRALAPWIVRSGHAHVGVTQDPLVVPDLVTWDPRRYGELALPSPSQRWEILGLVAAALKAGREPFADLGAQRVYLSGWSMTGTFCRNYLGEGFGDRCLVGGAPAVDGMVVCISSGGAGRAGYASPDPTVALPLDHPRRTVRGGRIPVIELLSECESETHRSVLRPDSDDPEDRYRLYQVAGTSHMTAGAPPLLTNGLQREARGVPARPRRIVEQPSDGRLDLVARAVFAALDRWVREGTPPPRAPRFAFDDPAGPATRGRSTEAVPLRRDADGNAVGGIRTPWVDVPAGAYLPHSTPQPGSCLPPPHAPFADPAVAADLIGHLVSFGPEEMKARYGDPDGYLERYETRRRELTSEGWLLAEDAGEVLAIARNHVAGW